VSGDTLFGGLAATKNVGLESSETLAKEALKVSAGRPEKL
jgi:hypothetical protein